MSAIDILLISIIVIIAIISIKRVKSSIKSGGCASCPHHCDCEKIKHKN